MSDSTNWHRLMYVVVDASLVHFRVSNSIPNRNQSVANLIKCDTSEGTG
jgi:hypothetical protein